MEKYAKENGDKEIEQIQESIKEKQTKELNDKRALEPAQPHFKTHMVTAMQKRNDEWEQRKTDFCN